MHKNNMDPPKLLSIPEDLLLPAEEFESFLLATSFDVRVNEDSGTFFHEKSLPEVIAIQRLLTLARNATSIKVQWNRRIADQVFPAPSIFPLMAVLICLDGTEHEVIEENGKVIAVDVQSSRKFIYTYRPLTDLFADRQIVICADSRGYGRPKAFYDNKGELISRTDFDSFVERLLTAQIGNFAGRSQASIFCQSVATILAELFENTDIHGKKDLSGTPFPQNGLRGMMFKRVTLSPRVRQHPVASRNAPVKTLRIAERTTTVTALEVSVFDSGVGYFASYMRKGLNEETSLTDEWRVLHKCLERHYEETIQQDLALPDIRSQYTGMGLYEVLRALQLLKGKFEVRSGRTYGFRTFLSGDVQMQLESSDSTSRPGMPRPVLLDNKLQFVRVPTENELLVGSSVRVLIPLN